MPLQIVFCQETCNQFWPDEKTETVDYKLVKVNYRDTLSMKDCDKVLLEVFSCSKVWYSSL